MENNSKITSAWKVANLNFTYPDGTKALDNINLTVSSGKKIALIGGNGAGKSTLLLCSLGILEKWTGEISFQEMSVTKKSYKKIRQQVGLLFQEPDDMLFMPTVADDVAFGPLNAGLSIHETEERVKYALNIVGLADRQNKAAHHLSAGEKKRAALASIISIGSKILLFDEPTSGLDPKSRRFFISLVQKLEGTVIIATHDLAMAAEATEETIVMHKGKIVATGLTSDILFNENLMKKYDLEVPCVSIK